ncbi:cytochrome c oxidase assembly protein [Bosea sp. RCC_152_1]|uniref:cytochrome c oxidase assembly protein n=1 Tax=Bosea sp. RCC_152_1 TaxID=3239228 RepID=UPI00352441E4
MKRSPALAMIAVVGAGDALAHGSDLHAAGMGWTFDPWIVLPLSLAGASYAIGVARLWHRVGLGHGVTLPQAGAYALGWLSLAAALVSPLHEWGEHLFTAHMIEHEIVIAVAAPLLVLARPAAGLLWAFPASLRHAIGRAMRQPWARRCFEVLTRPSHATVLHGLALWIWHVPLLFDAAVADVLLHRLQHLSFILTGVMFWWAVLRRCDAGLAVWHLFVTMMHMTILGALIALSPRVLYSLQTAQAARFGLTPLEDQQLAGLVMWVPAGTVYAGAALVFAARWIGRSGRRGEQRDAPRQA